MGEEKECDGVTGMECERTTVGVKKGAWDYSRVVGQGQSRDSLDVFL